MKNKVKYFDDVTAN